MAVLLSGFFFFGSIFKNVNIMGEREREREEEEEEASVFLSTKVLTG